MNADVRVGVLASGRGSNFAALVAAAAQGRLGARIVCLITDNPSAPVVATAEAAGVPVVVVDPGTRHGRLGTEAEQRIVDALRAHGVHLVCLAGFMRIVGPVLLAAFPGAILNVHPSLLPSFPGLDAQRQAFEHGVQVTGCTVHFVDAGIDSGPIVMQQPVQVHDDDTLEALTARILAAEHRAFPAAVRQWAEGRLRIHGRRVARLEATTVSRHPGAGHPVHGEA